MFDDHIMQMCNLEYSARTVDTKQSVAQQSDKIFDDICEDKHALHELIAES